ncbi:hypothetical protein D9758_013050 [Tetrapyrgos nigripes]|uniref:Uncharacterized protein n=1 Tax=Tetrapyrgos nigripes TaxID=182062 RepID=A0A8H5CPJ1_9AGAR|nr:hypothetical protein D9758_013050 [Tetrapyrgos nigripes]
MPNDPHDELLKLSNDYSSPLTMSSPYRSHSPSPSSALSSTVYLHSNTDNGSANVSRNPSSAGRGRSLSPAPVQYANHYLDPFAPTAEEGPTPKSAKSVQFADRPASESTLYDRGRSGPATPISPGMKHRSIRDSTHLIPTPLLTHPLSLRLPIAFGIPIMMFALGIGLEVGLYFSNRDNGFASFFLVFIHSIVPTLFVVPVAIAWRELDWYVRDLQPYVIMSKGNAVPEESVLLDYGKILQSLPNPSRANLYYILTSSGFAMLNSLKFKHRLVFWSSAMAMATYLFQPLAASIFSIQQLDRTWDSTANSIKQLSVNTPDIITLSPFVAAAGFADASVSNGLGDPPFVLNGWAVAEFVFPTDPLLNGSMIVNTTAIQTNPQCQNPSETPTVLPVSGSSSFQIVGTVTKIPGLPEGCKQSVQFDPNDAVQQYGVQAVGNCSTDGTPTPAIGNNVSLGGDIRFAPVMFWFYRNNTESNQPEARVVFCSPTIKGFNVKASARLDNRNLTKVDEINNYTANNDVFGGDNAGRAFNAVHSCEGSATNTGIPGTIFKAAQLGQGDTGLQQTFDSPNGFLDLTNAVYTRHLSFSAKAIYFTNNNVTVDAIMTELTPRLYVNPVPGHALAFSLIAVGIVGLIVHIFHRRQRRHLYLTNPPGTIASIIAMTSHSGIGELLMPYDKEKVLEKKLEDLRFGMDKRTGAVVVDGYARARQYGGGGGDGGSYYGGGKAGYAKLSKDRSEARDEAMMSLLGKNDDRPEHPRKESSHLSTESDPSMYESSARAAYDAANGNYPPTTGWRMSTSGARR